MTTEEKSLSDDQIRTRFVLTADIVRQAVGLARELQERATGASAQDEIVTVPSGQFQTLVESLGVMHKTLMESILAKVVAEESAEYGPDASVTGALRLSARLLKAQNGAALRQAKLLVDAVRETATDAGDRVDSVDVPAHVLKVISDAVFVTENLLGPVALARPNAPISENRTTFSDRGDLGFMKNWYNSGNIAD